VTDAVFGAGPQPGYQWLLADDDGDYQRLQAIADHRPGEAWQPPPMHLLDRDDDGTRLRQADLPWLLSATLALTPAASSGLRPLLEPYGEFLPVSGTAAGIELFNCTAWTDALDEDASELARFSDGRIMRIRSAVLTPAAFAEAEVVRLRQTPTGPLYFAAPLVERIAALGLTGTVFQPRGTVADRG